MGLFMNTRDKWESAESDWTGFGADLEVSDEDFVAAIERGRAAEAASRHDVVPHRH